MGLLYLGPIGQKALLEILHDYCTFITLLVALFTISGGIHLEGNLKAGVKSGYPCVSTRIGKIIVGIPFH